MLLLQINVNLDRQILADPDGHGQEMLSGCIGKSCIPIFPSIGLGSCSLPPAKGQAQLHTEFTTGGLVLGSVAGFQDDIVGCSDASNEQQ